MTKSTLRQLALTTGLLALVACIGYLMHAADMERQRAFYEALLDRVKPVTTMPSPGAVPGPSAPATIPDPAPVPEPRRTEVPPPGNVPPPGRFPPPEGVSTLLPSGPFPGSSRQAAR